MPEVRLKFNGGEMAPKEGVTTLGRTSDNDVAFPSDSNVSRYHAEIESRGGEFCLIDLGSSNGTTINGAKVSGETFLKPGDRIMLGGSSEVIFEGVEEPAKAQPAAEPETAGPGSMPPVGDAVHQMSSVAATEASTAIAGSRSMLFVAGGAVLVAAAVVGIAGVIYYRSVTAVCDAKAKIVKPEPGETIYEPAEIEVETENSECVAKAVFTLDGEPFATSDLTPYTATLDPAEHSELADGADHRLGITLIDEDGKRIDGGEIMLAMETRRIKDREDEKPAEPTDPPPTGPSVPKGKELNIIDVQRLTVQVSSQAPGGRGAPGKQFLLDVQKAANEYAQDGYYERAKIYRDVIRVDFIKNSFLPAQLGFVLAMSRSKFDPKKQGAEEGLWRLSPALIDSQKYGGDCGGESLSDPKQACSSRAAAAYLKELYNTACNADVMCAAATFGKPVQDAIVWRSALPKSGSDLWNTLKPGPERDQLVRFVAAAVVAENPSKFGLKRDQPISSLYP